MKIQNFSLPFVGFLQATGLLAYISLVAFILNNAEKVFGPMNNLLGPIAFLLLLVVSATTCGLLVLGRPGLLFWEKRYQEAFTLLGWTLGWSSFYLLAVFSLLFSLR